MQTKWNNRYSYFTFQRLNNLFPQIDTWISRYSSIDSFQTVIDSSCDDDAMAVVDCWAVSWTFPRNDSTLPFDKMTSNRDWNAFTIIKYVSLTDPQSVEFVCPSSSSPHPSCIVPFLCNKSLRIDSISPFLSSHKISLKRDRVCRIVNLRDWFA